MSDEWTPEAAEEYAQWCQQQEQEEREALEAEMAKEFQMQQARRKHG